MPSRCNRVLCAEDESDIREVVKLTLEAIGGFEVVTCEDGRAALDAAPACQPDLILLDVMMPGMDGPATLEALRASPDTAHIPVVFMTAKTQPQEVERLRALGVADVLAKPFDPMGLAAEVDRVWSEHVAGSCGD